MRTIPEPLQARLDRGVTTLGTAWRVTRADGAVSGFTDHDRDLAFGGVTFAARAGFAGGALEKSLAGEADTTSIAGILDDETIREADLLAGLWDGARVDIWRVDWTDPDLRVHVFSGRIGTVRHGAHALTAELRGPQAMLERPFGRVFSRACDADLGDARCGVDLASSAFAGAGVVTARPAPRTTEVSGLAAFDDGWFTRGVLTWSDGATVEVRAHRVAGDRVTLELAMPARAEGAAFTVTAGCDKRFATCRAKFANALRFRGFPDMPGVDVAAAGVDPGEPMDGGSRR